MATIIFSEDDLFQSKIRRIFSPSSSLCWRHNTVMSYVSKAPAEVRNPGYLLSCRDPREGFAHTVSEALGGS